MGALQDGYAGQPPQGLADRIRQRYIEYYSDLVAHDISDLAKQNGWKSIGLVAPLSADPYEGEALGGHIQSALREATGLSTPVRHLNQESVGSLIKGAYADLSDAERARLASYKDDAVIIGRIDKDLATFIFDMLEKRTEALEIAKNIGDIFGKPEFAIWDKLASKKRTDSDFRVEVWTERPSYRIGEELEICVRATRDCHITLVDLQTSGTMYVLFPNRYQQDNYVIADKIYRIGGASAPFSIAVNPPGGIEGLRAVATLKPLLLAEQQGEKGPFVSFKMARSQEEFVKRLVSQVEKLDASEWDVGEWTFRIME